MPPHHLGRVFGLIDFVARINPLGRESQEKIFAAFKAAFLQNRFHHFFGGTGIGRAFQHNQHALVHAL